MSPARTVTGGSLPEGSASQALWRRVAAAIRADVAELPGGTKLPSEAQQSESYGVSRVTLRQALRSLRTAGLIDSRVGLGWFVVDPGSRAALISPRPASEPVGRLVSFTEMARSQGHSPDSVVLEHSSRRATDLECDFLALAPDSEVMVLERLRRFDRRPVALDRSIVPLSILPDAMSIDFAAASLHACFRLAGAGPTFVDIELDAVSATAEQAHLLDVPPGAPLLGVRQAFFDRIGRPIERARILYRPDQYRFRGRMRA